MPEISRFYGIVIKMYLPTTPRHTSTRNTLSTRPGLRSAAWESCPATCLRARWGWWRNGPRCTRKELHALWERASKLQPLDRVDPLP